MAFPASITQAGFLPPHYPTYYDYGHISKLSLVLDGLWRQFEAEVHDTQTNVFDALRDMNDHVLAVVGPAGAGKTNLIKYKVR